MDLKWIPVSQYDDMLYHISLGVQDWFRVGIILILYTNRILSYDIGFMWYTGPEQKWNLTFNMSHLSFQMSTFKSRPICWMMSSALRGPSLNKRSKSCKLTQLDFSCLFYWYTKYFFHSDESGEIRCVVLGGQTVGMSVKYLQRQNKKGRITLIPNSLFLFVH